MENNQTHEMSDSVTMNTDENQKEQQQTLQQPLNPRKHSGQEIRLGQEQKHSFFLFINPMSGNNEGKLFLDLKPNYVQMNIDNKKQSKSQLNFNDQINQYDVMFHFINLADKNSQQEGVEKLKQTLQNQERQACAITCGGDGTVMWTTEVLEKAELELENIPMGIIPLGTGNDFSRALGWGPTSDIGGLIKKDFKKLRKLALKWIHGQVSDFDIWDLKFDTFEKGCFSVIKKKDGLVVEKVLEDEESKAVQTRLEKTFCNYFSTGVDARIGIEFDKNRTKSRLGNICVYAWASIKRFFQKKPKMGHTMQKLEEIKGGQNQSFEDNVSLQDNSMYDSNTVESEKIFQTRTGQNFKDDQYQLKQMKKNDLEEYNKVVNNGDRYLKGSPNCILVLNINSYAAGTTGIWSGGSKKGALIDIKDKKKLKQDQEFVKQQFSDGKIEIVSFDNMVNMGLGRVFPGQADRIAQGNGPFKFTFREVDKYGNPIKTYFQVDGEFYIVKQPKCVVVQKSKKVKNGKFKVIVQQKMYQSIQNQKE